jgi:hypothetical protein
MFYIKQLIPKATVTRHCTSNLSAASWEAQGSSDSSRQYGASKRGLQTINTFISRAVQAPGRCWLRCAALRRASAVAWRAGGRAPPPAQQKPTACGQSGRGHSLPSHPARMSTEVRYAPKSGSQMELERYLVLNRQSARSDRGRVELAHLNALDEAQKGSDRIIDESGFGRIQQFVVVCKGLVVSYMAELLENANCVLYDLCGYVANAPILSEQLHVLSNSTMERFGALPLDFVHV